MDIYMQSGYRNDRAREQRQAFSDSFLAPGIPVETIRPPSPPPPPVYLAPAAGAGGVATVPLGIVVAVGGGLALGLSVRKDIERFKYGGIDPVTGKYKPPATYYHDPEAYKPFDESKEVEVLYDSAADDLYKDHLYDLLKNFSFPQGTGVGSFQFIIDPIPGLPSTFYAADGFHGPAYRHGNTFYFWLLGTTTTTCHNTRDRWKSAGELRIPPSVGGCSIGPNDWFGNGMSNSCGVNQTRSGTATANWVCPSDMLNMATAVYSARHVGVASMTRGERWDINSLSAVGSTQPQGLVISEGTGTVSYPGAMVDLLDGDFTNAGDAAGGEPSLAEQVAGKKLPGGKAHRGYYVNVPINYPFTVIHVQPGSPPVTVPDVIIDPGSPTQPGTVTVVPPSTPPDFPTPEIYPNRGRKPTPQRIIHFGFQVINFVTETQDLFEALHKGLPKKLRTKGRKGKGDVPPWVILQDIWDHWDDWDDQVALEAFVNNQIEDAIYGRFFGLQSRAARRSGVTAGFARGLRGPRAIKLPVPEVHFANGEHTVSVGDTEIDLVTFRRQ